MPLTTAVSPGPPLGRGQGVSFTKCPVPSPLSPAPHPPTPPHPILVPQQIAHGLVKEMPTLAFCCICSSGRDVFDFLAGLPPSLPTLSSSFSMLEETDQRAQGTLAEVWLSSLLPHSS